MTKNQALLFDRLSEWMQCFCVVTFDLELGQSMEVVCPGTVQLTEQDKSNICYLAFPDSNSGCLGDTSFHFRIHLIFESPSGSYFDRRKSLVNYNRSCAPSLQTDLGMHFGYVCFRQVKDRSVRRGYFQKSVVLITKLPFLNIFREVLQLVAPEFFENGVQALEFACKEMDRWPSLQVGVPLSLPLFGHTLNVTIPSLLDGALPGASYPSNLSAFSSSLNIPITSIHDLDFAKTFHGFLSHLHIFWELVLCNEPLAVIAPSPTVCSEIVQGLIWIIWPLKYATDYRPFFTIHDQDFKDYTTRTQSPPRNILGVTNPFFVKTLQHWPHVIRVGEDDKNKADDSAKTKTPFKLSSTVDFKQGLYSEYKPYLNKDKALIKRLQKGIQSKRPTEAQSSLIKKYYYELTRSFLIPLERYVSTLMPLLRDISPFRMPPTLRDFNVEEFLETVEVAGPQLTSGTKGDWQGLYTSFLKSENFGHWFQMRKAEINQKLRLIHLEAVANADLEAWSTAKSEVELVDMILQIRSRVHNVRNDGTVIAPDLHAKLRQSLETVMGKLPPDLNAAIKNNQRSGSFV
ncbi:LOW QUALITY PROTEIN: protein DENND6A-like [Paramacrobiotus metropolitanus]|uniref:LOW QUALITY PROTEIN: protein DENND6A-like n=1 Tax=Paramacrobiotus metropolitanus TaxID=2943436 RepID=UPI00244600B9|nr:LOW QUALITY PROTEIN: protein DENND6A-like [Paramacrobiotus metropolitanus]